MQQRKQAHAWWAVSASSFCQLINVSKADMQGTCSNIEGTLVGESDFVREVLACTFAVGPVA